MRKAVRYLIDTNCCIFLFAGEYPALLERIAATPVGAIGLSSIVFAELALGVRHGKPPLERQLQQLTTQMPILPFDEAAARCYAQLPFAAVGSIGCSQPMLSVWAARSSPTTKPTSPTSPA